MLHLFIQDVYGRLRRYDEVAQQHPHGNEQPAVPDLRQRLTDLPADGHEADVGARQEKREAHEGIRKTDEYLDQLTPGERPRHELKENEKRYDGRNGAQHFQRICTQSPTVRRESAARGFRHKHGFHLVLAAFRLINDAENHHGENGTDTAQRHQTEAVVAALFAASHGGDAHAQRHDEGNRDGTRRDAARIKGNRPEALGDEQERHGEQGGVKNRQQNGQADAEHDAQHGDRQKDPHAHGNGDDEHHIFYIAHLLRQNLQIRLRHRDDDADDKADKGDQPDLFALRESGAHLLPDDEHGHIRAEREQRRSHNQQQHADGEKQKGARF